MAAASSPLLRIGTEIGSPPRGGAEAVLQPKASRQLLDGLKLPPSFQEAVEKELPPLSGKMAQKIASLFTNDFLLIPQGTEDSGAEQPPCASINPHEILKYLLSLCAPMAPKFAFIGGAAMQILFQDSSWIKKGLGIGDEEIALLWQPAPDDTPNDYDFLIELESDYPIDEYQFLERLKTQLLTILSRKTGISKGILSRSYFRTLSVKANPERAFFSFAIFGQSIPVDGVDESPKVELEFKFVLNPSKKSTHRFCLSLADALKIPLELEALYAPHLQLRAASRLPDYPATLPLLYRGLELIHVPNPETVDLGGVIALFAKVCKGHLPVDDTLFIALKQHRGMRLDKHLIERQIRNHNPKGGAVELYLLLFNLLIALDAQGISPKEPLPHSIWEMLTSSELQEGLFGTLKPLGNEPHDLIIEHMRTCTSTEALTPLYALGALTAHVASLGTHPHFRVKPLPHSAYPNFFLLTAKRQRLAILAHGKVEQTIQVLNGQDIKPSVLKAFLAFPQPSTVREPSPHFNECFALLLKRNTAQNAHIGLILALHAKSSVLAYKFLTIATHLDEEEKRLALQLIDIPKELVSEFLEGLKTDNHVSSVLSLKHHNPQELTMLALSFWNSETPQELTMQLLKRALATLPHVRFGEFAAKVLKTHPDWTNALCIHLLQSPSARQERVQQLAQMNEELIKVQCTAQTLFQLCVVLHGKEPAQAFFTTALEKMQEDPPSTLLLEVIKEISVKRVLLVKPSEKIFLTLVIRLIEAMALRKEHQSEGFDLLYSFLTTSLPQAAATVMNLRLCTLIAMHDIPHALRYLEKLPENIKPGTSDPSFISEGLLALARACHQSDPLKVEKILALVKSAIGERALNEPPWAGVQLALAGAHIEHAKQDLAKAGTILMSLADSAKKEPEWIQKMLTLAKEHLNGPKPNLEDAKRLLCVLPFEVQKGAKEWVEVVQLWIAAALKERRTEEALQMAELCHKASPFSGAFHATLPHFFYPTALAKNVPSRLHSILCLENLPLPLKREWIAYLIQSKEIELAWKMLQMCREEMRDFPEIITAYLDTTITWGSKKDVLSLLSKEETEKEWLWKALPKNSFQLRFKLVERLQKENEIACASELFLSLCKEGKPKLELGLHLIKPLISEDNAESLLTALNILASLLPNCNTVKQQREWIKSIPAIFKKLKTSELKAEEKAKALSLIRSILSEEVIEIDALVKGMLEHLPAELLPWNKEKKISSKLQRELLCLIVRKDGSFSPPLSLILDLLLDCSPEMAAEICKSLPASAQKHSDVLTHYSLLLRSRGACKGHPAHGDSTCIQFHQECDAWAKKIEKILEPLEQNKALVALVYIKTLIDHYRLRSDQHTLFQNRFPSFIKDFDPKILWKDPSYASILYTAYELIFELQRELDASPSLIGKAALDPDAEQFIRRFINHLVNDAPLSTQKTHFLERLAEMKIKKLIDLIPEERRDSFKGILQLYPLAHFNGNHPGYNSYLVHALINPVSAYLAFERSDIPSATYLAKLNKTLDALGSKVPHLCSEALASLHFIHGPQVENEERYTQAWKRLQAELLKQSSLSCEHFSHALRTVLHFPDSRMQGEVIGWSLVNACTDHLIEQPAQDVISKQAIFKHMIAMMSCLLKSQIGKRVHPRAWALKADVILKWTKPENDSIFVGLYRADQEVLSFNNPPSPMQSIHYLMTQLFRHPQIQDLATNWNAAVARHPGYERGLTPASILASDDAGAGPAASTPDLFE